ncbi:MAG: RagB/SusD family nutrient uptake outer membrane protein [Chitinophaga sp.]|jgi:starch-binding outer membrane protein, SusD/RagB family|nr:RagB/SusD family nutrient uptake outer membrane protein [Chitinophaga sp.]
MKKLIQNKTSIFLVSLIAVTALFGCKHYLDEQPITQFGTDFVFSTRDNAYQAIAGVYSRLVGDQGYGIRLSLYYTVDNDETQGPTGASDNDRRDIARYAATAGNAQLNSPFNQLFTGIEYANICIANIPKMAQYNGNDATAKQLKRMHGEALTLRAQYYFEAIRNWGDLPANFQPAAEIAAANPLPSRVNRDTLYNKILDDLLAAESLVPWKNELSSIGDPVDERITKGTVKALRARIALFRGGYSLRNTSGQMERSADYLKFYQIARDECNDIINSGQHALNPDYKNLWKNNVCAHAIADSYGELMFQASAVGATGTEDTKLGFYNGPTVGSFGNKSINIMPTYFYAFDSADLRRDVTCCVYNVNADGSTKAGTAITAINDGKYRRDWITNPVVSPTNAVQYFSLKWQIIRYSDVLLMFAEADNEINNGPTAAAYNAVNMVRRRGFGKSLTATSTVDLPAGLSKSQFFTAIVNERSFELGGEGIRKYDLIRWNLLTQKINDTKTALTVLATGAAPYTGLPASMYFKTNSTSDDNTITGGAWANSFYKAAPSSTPSGTTKITWIGSTITATGTSSPLGRFATGFTTNKSELLPIPQAARDANPNLSQNPGY